jgi:hypothetical protein
LLCASGQSPHNHITREEKNQTLTKGEKKLGLGNS